jgi:hypothetical protein
MSDLFAVVPENLLLRNRMSRSLKLLLLFGLVLARPVFAQGDIYFEEKRLFGEQEQKTLKEALAKMPEDEPLTDKHKELVEVAVRHLVYPLTSRDPRGNKDIPKFMSRQVLLCDGWMADVFSAKQRDGKEKNKHTELQAEFLKKWLVELDRLLSNPQQFAIVRVNAARLLARLAFHSGREETADLLVKVLTDPQQVEGTRYYACQGLKELLARGKPNEPAVKDAKRRGDTLKALVSFIQRKPPFTPTTPEEVDGLRMMRREALRALANLRQPLLEGDPNGKPVLTFCRILRRDKGLDLDPRADEIAEAAVGLGQMPADMKNHVEISVVAWHLGYGIVAFAQQFVQSRDMVPREPWRYNAARMLDALQALAKANPDDPVVRNVAQEGAGVLQAIEQGRTPTNLDALEKWLKENKPPKQAVYKNDPKSEVTPREEKPSS